jgi:hypothetical protein
MKNAILLDIVQDPYFLMTSLNMVAIEYRIFISWLWFAITCGATIIETWLTVYVLHCYRNLRALANSVVLQSRL